jgi:2-dehydro-3-deoxyphosphogluconate aldolase/(4S)-4-hydroxy-2-oxoglutarate aldolase
VIDEARGVAVNTTYQRIGVLGIVPVIAIEDAEAAVPLADALAAGGLPVAEITFRTVAAADVIERIAHQRPEILVGAGTVISEENLRSAIDCGAAFGVSPGLNPTIFTQATKRSFPFVPGVMTPSDIENAIMLGAKLLKFFPAGAAGGTQMLKSIAAPYVHTGIRFMPTGGIKTDNVKDYLCLDIVFAVGGTWIATREDIASKRWNVIRDNCRKAVDIVSEMKRATAIAL